MKKYELLSPAGDFSCMRAAFNAGADAVYLAGKSFGARAFAGNFETEELIEALDYAHLFNKKIYLTLNTLIKENEFSSIKEYLTPFYEHGLDGVIIQDLGLIPYLKREFPYMELHGSTQMTVSNYRSASWLKEQGICRVVPARELSLTELLEIKQKSQIEVEAFIHGAMCYSYSGQCLFSSFLGGRSGNRGRCAQPCRLPYKVMEGKNCLSGKKEVYPLSLKDLSSLMHIYELMDAGIDSFKIEGRMKSPEYVAGVTAVYRKYMDLYEKGERKPVAREDLEKLAHLYIRSDMKDGYLKKHNGKDMVSVNSPSYQGCDDNLVSELHSQYCEGHMKYKISGRLDLTVDKPAELRVYTGCESITIKGDVVQAAQNRPLAKEDVLKQMLKTGNSWFEFAKLDVEMNGNIFLPVKKLNELRREALDTLQDVLLQQCLRMPDKEKTSRLHMEEQSEGVSQKKKDEANQSCFNEKNILRKPFLNVSVMSKEQLDALLDSKLQMESVYVPADLFYRKEVDVFEIKEMTKKKEVTIIPSLPRMIRKRDDAYLAQITKWLSEFEVVMVKSLEGLAFLKEIDYKGQIVTDHSVYNWNKSALAYLNEWRNGFTYPLEYSFYENRSLDDYSGEYVVYGRTPMMLSANCVRKTMDCCNAKQNSFGQILEDRYRKELPVFTNCVHCYNEIFNAVPMSLHKELPKLINSGFKVFRLAFTDEGKDKMMQILEYYNRKLANPKYAEEFPVKEYTQGHFKEGAV